MKTFILAGLMGLAACGASTEKQVAAKAPKVDPTQVAVSAYLKQTLDDPASYQPAQWGKPTPWQQRDADALAAQDAAEKANIAFQAAKHNAHSISTYGQRLFNENTADAKHFQRLEDSLLHTTDTTRLRQVITHAYRAKNKLGALQLDSAQFIVYKNGKVKPL